MSLPPLPFKVKTTVSWAGEQDGDLGFLENEVIEVFAIVDDSWWNGKLRRNKSEGIFPKDYVKVLEQTSQTNTPVKSNQMSRQNTPKELDYRASKVVTPGKPYSSRSSPKKMDYDDFSFDNSYENLEKSKKRSSRALYQQLPLQQPPGITAQMHNLQLQLLFQQLQQLQMQQQQNQQQQIHLQQLQYQQQEELAKKREIEKFKSLQQQHNYHIKSSPDDKLKRYLQQDFARNSIANIPDSPTSRRSNGAKLRPRSGQFEYHRQASTPNFRNANQYDFTNQVDSFSPEASPTSNRRMKLPYNQQNQPDELDEIVMKKRQLELELLQLEELQRSTIQMRKTQNKPPSSPNRFHYENGNDSYISEDLNSSKKNYHSKEDLSKKLSTYPTDDEINIYDNEASSSPPPPPPPKHQSPVKALDEPTNKIPYDADDFKLSGNKKMMLTEEEFMRLSQVQQEELKNSIKSLQSDVLNLSELSATSAGSFLRHKYEKEYLSEQEIRMKNLSLNDTPATELNGQLKDENLMDTIFQDKKKNPGIFKKFLKRKDEPSNLLEQKLQQAGEDREIDWTTFKLELNRMNTLTSQDKQTRTKRVVREEPSIIVKPFDFVSEINTNETMSEDYTELTFNDGVFDKVDSFAARYHTGCDLNELISDVGIKFNGNKINQIRCVLIHFMKFNIIEETSKIQQIKPKLNEILSKGEGSIYQLNYLFKKVLDALRIPCEIVLGFWKKPNEFYHDEQYIINHCWLSVLIESQFLIIDLLNFKNGDICNIKNSKNNEFYFLAKPLSIISTHIPSIIDLQHVIPPIDQNIAFYLPRLYSGYHKNKLAFKNYNNSLTRLKNLEIFETDLEIPVNIELFTLIKTSTVTSNEFSLCQIYWNNNKRIAKIKAILPQDEPIGVLQIFSGPKGLQKHFNNIHELSVVIPLHHEGESKPIKFVPRYPTVQSQNNDLYVKSPQTNQIIVKNSYNFSVSQYPSMGITNNSKILNQDFKIVIESPSGKYFKLTSSEPNKPYGTFENFIKCQELGLYRGLVIGDSGNSWYVFAQWECVGGTVI